MISPSSIFNNNNNFFQPTKCRFLNMLRIPYIGKYTHTNNIFMQPISVLTSNNNKPKNIPKSLSIQIDEIRNLYNKQPTFLHITCDASMVYNIYNERKIQTDFIRLNFFPHPYLFSDDDFNRNFNPSKRSYLSIFTPDNSPIYIKSSNEKDGLMINPTCKIFDTQLCRDISLNHLNNNNNNCLFAQNNCAFLLNLNNQIINFYVCVIGENNGKLDKYCICEYVIFPNTFTCNILNDFPSILANHANNTNELMRKIYIEFKSYKDRFKYMFFNNLYEIYSNPKSYDKFKESLITTFGKIFSFWTEKKYYVNSKEREDLQNKYNIDIKNVGTYYYNSDFGYFIYHLFNINNSNIPDFSEGIVNDILGSINNYYIDILIKYMNFHFSKIFEIFTNYLHYLNQNVCYDSLKAKYSQEYNNLIFKKIKIELCNFLNINVDDLDKKYDFFFKRKNECNRNIILFSQMVIALQKKPNLNDFIFYLNQIDTTIKKYLFYNVWLLKGKLLGIHGNFGEMSFTQNKHIDEFYHCTKEEQINICQKMITILEEIDKKYLKINTNN